MESSRLCALCQTMAKLHKSHIIPEFFFRMVYDEPAHQFHVVSDDPEKPEFFRQKGLWERLLCEECEQKMSKWEHYAKNTFVDGRGLLVKEQATSVVLQNLEYKTFKLFQLSLLWRMSISSLRFFEEVSLGPYEEKIRQALLREDPLSATDYPCVMTIIKISGQFHPSWITQPSRARFRHQTVYWLIICGFLYVYFVGNLSSSIAWAQLLLSENNQMTVPIGDARDLPFVSETITKLGTAIGKRKENALSGK